MREYRGFLVTTLARALLPTLWLVLGAAAWSQETTDQRTITATYDGTDIRQIISAVADITGKKFIIHPDVDAKVTMDISTSVSVSAFYDIFLSILQTHGYEAVSRGDVVHVVPVGTEPGAGSAPPEPRDTAKYIADSIRPTPYFVDGQMRGIRVYPGSNRVTFDAFGFEPGDLIIDYDGLPLADSRALVNFLNSLEASTIGYVTLDRNGEITVIQMPYFDTADIREVAAAVSEISGKKFVFHPSIDETVTLDLSELGNSDVIYEAFLSELRKREYQTSVGGKNGPVYVFPIGRQQGVEAIDHTVRDYGWLLNDAIRPLRVFILGWVMGVRVYPGTDQATFVELGFEPGDLIVKYDDHPLVDAEDFTGLFMALNAADNISVSLYRDGELVVIQLP